MTTQMSNTNTNIDTNQEDTTSMTTNTDIDTMTNALDRLKAGVIDNGTQIDPDTILTAVAAALLNDWKAARAANLKAAKEAEAKTYTTEVAELVANMLGDDDAFHILGLPRQTRIVPTMHDDIESTIKAAKGNPIVVLTPASVVTWKADGCISGKVKVRYANFEVRNAMQGSPGVLARRRLAYAHMHDFDGQIGDGCIFNVVEGIPTLPVIESPSVENLATSIAYRVQNLQATSMGMDNVSRAGSVLDHKIVSAEGDKIVARFTIGARVTNNVGHSLNLFGDEVKHLAYSMTKRGFFPSLGHVDSIEEVHREPWTQNGVQVTFQVVARAKVNA